MEAPFDGLLNRFNLLEVCPSVPTFSFTVLLIETQGIDYGWV